LIGGDVEDRKRWFRESRDRKVEKRYPMLWAGQDQTPIVNLEPNAPMPDMRRYGYRSFDRQWCLADGRLGDYLRADLWATLSERQVFLTSLLSGVLGLGPAMTVTACIPDMDHFRGSFGAKHAIPLWRDTEATQPNVTVGLLEFLSKAYGCVVAAEDLFAYAYAIFATPRYVDSFSEELTVPGPRLPLTLSPELFAEAVLIGRKLIWWHTYGERFVPVNTKGGQVPKGAAVLDKAIPGTQEGYPEDFAYDPATRELRVGAGVIVNVAPEIFDFSVSGLEVVKSWLAYRMKNGAGKKSSSLDDIRPERWTQAMSQELMQLLWLLEHTLAEYPKLADLLDRIVAGPLFAASDLPYPDDIQRKPQGRDEDDTEAIQPLLV